MNFFAWIREGVRQAVLLGVSDAVEHIGTPPEGEDIRHIDPAVVRRVAPQERGADRRDQAAILRNGDEQCGRDGARPAPAAGSRTRRA